MGDWYAELVQRMTTPSFAIDNEACSSATVIEVIWTEAMNKQGILLEVVQFLADLNLIIPKANMSSDGEWCMDVFHVTDVNGNKLQKEEIGKIEESLATEARFSGRSSVAAATTPSKKQTSIELTGADRPGLLSNISAVLRDMRCSVVEAELWTHNMRAAAVVQVADDSTGDAIEDPARVSAIEELLRNVVRGDNAAAARAGNMTVLSAVGVHRERRLHQMMCAARDYERAEQPPPAAAAAAAANKTSRQLTTQVGLSDCAEKEYSVVTLRCKDRPKLLFDTLCTLTDLQYVVFHGTVTTEGTEARHEYYIRHADGLPIRSEAESQRVIQCLEAAIERRTSEGLELELQTEDRVGLLSDITRIFRENGLSIRRAEIATKGGRATDTFVVDMPGGGRVDQATVDSVRRQAAQMGKAVVLKVKGGGEQVAAFKQHPEEWTGFLLFLGILLKACSFQSFGVIRSYS